MAAGSTSRSRYKDVVRAGVYLPEDLPKNHDHYLHGTPKQ